MLFSRGFNGSGNDFLHRFTTAHYGNSGLLYNSDDLTAAGTTIKLYFHLFTLHSELENPVKQDRSFRI